MGKSNLKSDDFGSKSPIFYVIFGPGPGPGYPGLRPGAGRTSFYASMLYGKNAYYQKYIFGTAILNVIVPLL